jgi:predicted NodU family carbamoyl transferase
VKVICPTGKRSLGTRATFEIGAHTKSHEFMLFASAVKAGLRDRIPAVLHHDGTARL